MAKERENLTSGLIGKADSEGKQQRFIRDAKQPGLALRVTLSGHKAFIYEDKLAGKAIRITIGDVQSLGIGEARDKAAELRAIVKSGRDPRVVKQERTEADIAKREQERRQVATFGDAWKAYLEERKPHWGELHYRDHVALAQVGGQVRRRNRDVKTIDGPLAVFMPMRLSDITPELILEWTKKETVIRPTRARLALRLLNAFLNWCSHEKEYQDITNTEAARNKKIRDAAGSPGVKNDYLQREQLATWFNHVQKIQNPIISTFLQCLLLTGARREELATLKWSDINFKWRGMTLKDKVEGERQIPLTPYVMHLIDSLPRRNEWVFSSTTSQSGRLIEPSIQHRRACDAAGLHGLTLHGVRRSFASLCEWLEIPGGVSAQIQGHKPQGVRELNYIRRPLDLLRVHHDTIEAWMLEQAGIKFDAKSIPAKIRVVA
ncbi:tyrosine-type recombinase/integrase [Advenella sp. RU8]|uniref:tyrosine-type recombinase/integrase n=1 Tax=Advenella sp. RU8 TaxID=3399575 RepID=UPI003AAF72B8